MNTQILTANEWQIINEFVKILRTEELYSKIIKKPEEFIKFRKMVAKDLAETFRFDDGKIDSIEMAIQSLIDKHE